jgi:lysophospholipase L1-like esterase
MLGFRAIAFALLLALCPVGRAPAADPLPVAGELVIIGDSVSAPANPGAWPAGQGYGALVAARGGLTEVNLAVSGATSVQRPGVPWKHDQWMAAIARSPKPVGIIAQLGENDIYWQPPVAEFKAQIDADVAAALAAGIPVTLNTAFHRQIPSSWYRAALPYMQAIREVGAARGLVVVDVFAWFAQLALCDPNYLSYFYTGDGINAHPTVAGQAVIASLFQLPQYANAVGYSAPPPPLIATVPLMTAATTAGVTITGNDLNSTGTTSSAPVWMSAADPAYTIQFNQGGTGWIAIQYPSPFVARAYSLRADPRTVAGAQAHAPKTRTLQGWNGSAWVDLEQVIIEGGWTAGERRQRDLAGGLAAFSLYRLNVTASQSGTYLQLRELQIFR